MKRDDPLLRLREHRLGPGRRPARMFEAVGPQSLTNADAAPPTFVLVHGLGLDSAFFVPLAEELAASGRVFVLELPGFGGVPHPRRPMTIPDFARVLVRAVDGLGIVAPVFVGHSMGAQVVVEAVALEPRLGGAVVLVGPVVNARERNAARVLWRFVESARHERPGAALESVRGYLRSAPRWSLEVFPSLLAYPVEERIASLTGELFILRGTHDVLCPPEWVAELAAAASGCTVRTRTIEGAAHQVVIDHAREVAGAARSLAGPPGVPS